MQTQSVSAARFHRVSLCWSALLVLMLAAVVQAQFLFTTNNGAITVIGYTGPFNGSAAIPAATNGYPVTAIGSNAFYNCFGLTNLTVPNTVTSIGYQAFYGCSSLTNMTIPASVTNIGDGAFFVCYRLTSIIVDPNNPCYGSLAGVLFNKNQTALMAFPEGLKGNYTIPGSVTSVGILAFYCCYNLSSVTIPATVTKIGDRAFFDCSGLTGLTIPKSVTNIGVAAFFGCSNLRSITVDTNNPSYSSVAGALFNKNQTVLLAYPEALIANYAIPDSVTTIGEEAFGFCGLLGVTIPNSVTNIGNYAFNQSQRLSSVTIPASVASLGSYAFSQCPMLFKACFSGNAPIGDSTIFSGGFGTVYYLPGTTGWTSTFGGWPTALWYQPNPTILGSGYGLGPTTNGFGLTISWATNAPVVVEACTNLTSPVWLPLATNTLTGGTSRFNDSQWMNSSARYYRLRSP